MKKISQQDIEALVELFDRSEWREMHVTGEGIDLFVSKDADARRPDTRGAAVSSTAPSVTSKHSGIALGGGAPDTLEKDAPDVPPHWVEVRAPCLGTFYRAPKPGAPALVSVGQRITSDTEVCLIEVMKLFTTVRAGVAGIVRAVLVSDGELVESDQVLFLIEPNL